MRLKKDYRIAESALANVRIEERPVAVMEGVWRIQMVCPPSQMATFHKRLTPGQRAFLTLGFLESEVDNGGIHQYLWNTSGNTFQEALAALETLGAQQHLKLLRKVEQLFPDPAMLKNHKRRRKAADKIGKKTLDQIFDTPFGILESKKRTKLAVIQASYFKKNRDQFVLPSNLEAESNAILEPGKRDYRITNRKAGSLSGEGLHWALIAKIWDDYFEQLNAGSKDILSSLPTLSNGQRALIAIDIFGKSVHLGGVSFFLANQVGVDVLAAEVANGFELLVAKPYSDVFERVMLIARDLIQLNLRSAEKNRTYSEAKKLGNSEAIKKASQEFTAALELKTEWEQSNDEVMSAFTEEFNVLQMSAEFRIESYIEAYVCEHPDEFFRC